MKRVMAFDFLSFSKYFTLLICSLIFVNNSYSQAKQLTTQAPLTQVTIGIFNNPPLSFANKDGHYQGYVIDIIERIAKIEGFEVKWQMNSWHSIVEKLKKNELDAITSVAFTKERTQFMQYSKNNLFVGWSQVFLPIDSPIEGFLDLNNKKIAILKGGVNGKRLMERCQKFDINCIDVEVRNYETGFNLLVEGQVDAVASNNLTGVWYSNKLAVTASSIVFNATKGFVAIPKGADSTFLNVFDNHISQWKKDKNSFYYQAQSKWLKPKYEINQSKNIWYIVIGLALLSLLTFIAALVFKRQVARRAKEISVRNEQFSQIINLVPHIIYVADERGNILLANKKASEYFGMTQDEIERCSIENYKKHQFNSKNFLNDNHLSQSFDANELNEITTTDYRDNQYTLLLSKMPFTGMKKRLKSHVIVAVDISEIKQYEKKIINLAHYNQVSGLPNKALFKIKLEQSIHQFAQHGKTGALLFIDLDEFKNINGLHGYRIGDVLIKALVKRFNKKLRDYKTLAHLGGDEFIIDLPELHKEAVVAEVLAVQFTELVQAMISKPLRVEEMLFEITACVGIVLYPRDGTTEERLIQRLGTALNEAKNQGINNLKLFDRVLEKKVKQNHSLESELRLALSNNQFIVHYQPILAANSRRVVGAEALIRWNHPTKGLIGPGEFVEVAEKIRLIVQIGDWVLEQACKRIRENIIAGKKDFFIAVNVSVLQIKNKYFLKRIENLISQYNIPANHIEIEITESVLMEDISLSISLFNKLKLLGVKISIDDFGTGYSSFSYLIKLPIDKIKIDQSFVKNLPKDNNSATIVKTIINMAHELDMKVVAEGVETIEQYEFLINEGCQFFQGYYLHRPMEYKEIAKLN